MNKKEYRAAVVAHKKIQKQKRLINLLINYRSKTSNLYPPGFIETMMQIKEKRIGFDFGGLWYFVRNEGNCWDQPSFNCQLRQIIISELEWAKKLGIESPF